MANYLATVPDFLSLILEQLLCPGRTGMIKIGILIMQTNIQEYLEQLDEVLQLFQGFRIIVPVSGHPDLEVSLKDGRVAPLKQYAVVKRFGLFQ